MGALDDSDYLDQLDRPRSRPYSRGGALEQDTDSDSLDAYRQAIHQRNAAADAQRAQAAEAERAARDAPPQFAPDAQDETVAQQPEPKAQQSALRDFGDQVWSSTLETGQAALGAVSYATRQLTSDPEATAWIERRKASLADQITKTYQGMSEQGQLATDASVLNYFGGKGPTPGDAGWARYVGATVAGLVPQLALAAIPGGIAEGVAMRVLGAGATVGKVARIGTTAAAFGSVGAGQAYNAAVEELDKATPEQMADSPAYTHLRETGLSDIEAKRALISSPAFAASFLGHFAVNAAAGAGVGELVTKGVLGAGERGLVKRVGVGALEGAGVMGGQSAADDAITQATQQSIGTRKEYDPSQTALALASGALGGAVLGAGAGVFHGGAHPVAEVEPERTPLPPIAPDLAAALDTQLRKDTPPDAAAAAPPAPPAPPAQLRLPAPPEQKLLAPPGEAPRAGPGAINLDGPPEPPAPTDPGTPPTEPPPPGAPPPEPPPGDAGTPPAPLPPTPPTQGGGGGAAVAAAPTVATPRPVSRVNLVNQLIGLGESPMTLHPMSTEALQRRLDSLQPKAEAPASTGVSVTTPEPPGDIAAQLKAVADPANPKDAMFVAKGTPMPKGIPKDMLRVLRPEGTLLTTSAAKAKAFRDAKPLTDSHMAAILGLPETKQEAAASGAPVAVQGRDAAGNVVSEALASPKGAAQAAQAVAEHVPGGTVHAVTPEDVQARRAAGGAAPAPTVVDPAIAEAAKAAKLADVKARLAKPKPVEAPKTTPGTAVTAPKQPKPTLAQDVATRTAEAAQAIKGEEMLRAHEEQLVTAGRDVQAAFTKARNAIVVKKGANIEGLVTRALRDLMEHVGRTDGSGPAVEEAVTKWGRNAAKVTGPIPGTTTGWTEVANKTLNLLGFKDLKDTRDFARAAAREPVETGAAPKGVQEEGRSEATSTDSDAPSVEQATVGPAQVAYHAAEAIDERNSATTDLNRHASDAVQRILDGGDANKESLDYGKRAENSKTHTRTLAAYVDSLIEHYGDPELRKTLLEQENAIENNKKLTEDARTNKLQPIHDELNKTEPEHLERLRQMRDAMVDPVGAATKRAISDEQKAREAQRAAVRQGELERQAELDAQKDQRATAAFRVDNTPEARAERLRKFKAGEPLFHRATPDGIQSERSRFVRDTNDARLNRVVTDSIQRAEAAGQPYTTHQAFRTIIDNAASMGNVSRPLVDLAKRLLKLAPDAPMLSRDAAVQHGIMNERHAAQFDSVATGAYFPGADNAAGHIVLNTKQPGSLETLLHEAVHAVGSRYIDMLQRTDPQHPDLQVLKLIMQELRNNVDPNDTRLNNMMWSASDSPHEMHAWLSTNPELQQLARNTATSSAFNAKIAELGLTPREPGRSVWRAFTDWTRRILGLKAPATVSEYTLLDHLMRATESITEQASAYNERLLTNDPTLRATAEPLYRTMTESAGEARDRTLDALNRAGLSGLRDRGAEAALAASSNDAILNHNREIFDPLKSVDMPAGNPLVRLHAAIEKVAYRAKTFLNSYQDDGHKIIRDFRGLSGKVQQGLAQLMNDATIANARLGSADRVADNAHLTKPEQQAPLAGLHARYDALPAAAQDLYGRIRDLYAKTYQEERHAQLSGLLGKIIPTATAEQRDSFASVARSKAGFEEFLQNPDNSVIAASFGKDWSTHRALAQGIANALQVGFVRGDYFELNRYGDYVIRYGDPKDLSTYGVERFEKRGDADARYAELAKQGVERLQHVDLDNPSYLKQLNEDHPLIAETVARMRRDPALAKNADATQELMQQIALSAATRVEGSRMRRRGVAGASTDIMRGIAKHIINTSQRMGYLEHGGERFDALADMRTIQQDLTVNGQAGQAIRARQVIREFERKLTASDNPGGALAGLSRRLNAFGFVQSLMSWSHMLTSTVEAHSMSVPILGSRHGMGSTSLALTRALNDLGPKLVKTGARNSMKGLGGQLRAADWNLAKMVRDQLIAKGYNAEHMTALFDALDRGGLVDHSFIRELRRMANPGGTVGTKLGDVWGRFSDFMGAGAHAVDVMNKSAIAKAAFDLEMKKSKGDVAASVAYAVQSVRDTSPNYNFANKARVSTSAGPLGGMAGPVTQFKQYGLFMYGVLGNLAKVATSHGPSDARLQARIAFAGILATHAMTAGVLTWIADPMRYIMGLYDFFTSNTGKPHDYENDVRRWMTDIAGPTLGEVLARGLPHLAGIDIHRRVGMANLLEIPGLNSFDKRGVIDMLGTAMIGAAGEDAAVFMDGIHKALAGDYLGGIQGMMPRPVRDISKAIALSNQGVVDSRGRTELPASKLSLRDIAAQAVGFQPAIVSETREGHAAVQEAQAEAKADRTQLAQAWISAAPGDRAGIMTQIRQFNQANPGTPLTVAQMVQQMASAAKQAKQAPGAYGVRLPPKAARYLVPAGRFANT